MSNNVTLIGNLVEDPELRFTASGVAMARVRMAVNRRYRDRNNEWQEDTSFFNVVAWGDLAENTAASLTKGNRIVVTGRIPEPGLALLRDVGDVWSWDDDDPIPGSVLHERAAGADAVVSLITDRIDSDVLDAAPSLRVVANVAVGYDNIDVAAATDDPQGQVDLGGGADQQLSHGCGVQAVSRFKPAASATQRSGATSWGRCSRAIPASAVSACS